MQVVGTLGEIKLNNKAKFVISVVSTKQEGKFKLDLRKWFLNFDGVWLATKQGLTVSADEVNTIISMLQKYDPNTTTYK
jgi:hypothetical protein